MGITRHTPRQALAAANMPHARADTHPGVCTAIRKKILPKIDYQLRQKCKTELKKQKQTEMH